jgi:hypothetical protein
LPQPSDRFLAFITVVGLAAATLAGIAAYVTRPLLPYVVKAEQLVSLGAEGQTSSTAVNVDLRDFSRQNRSSTSSSLAYRALDRGVDSTIKAPAVAKAWTAGATPVIDVPLPPQRPKNLSAGASGLLNDAQIIGIKNRLGLSPKQAEHWPAVEEALREIAQRHLQHLGTNADRTGLKIYANSPEVQRLIEASVPLIQRLREDQKREVRALVRMIGLGTVASQI